MFGAHTSPCSRSRSALQGRISREVVPRGLAAFLWRRVRHVTLFGAWRGTRAKRSFRTGHVERALPWWLCQPMLNGVARNPSQASQLARTSHILAALHAENQAKYTMVRRSPRDRRSRSTCPSFEPFTLNVVLVHAISRHTTIASSPRTFACL